MLGRAAQGANMLTYRSAPNSKIVEIAVDGAVTRQDFNDVIGEINSKIDSFGSVDVLEEIRSIGETPPAVILADLRWVASHMKKVGRAAVVCDKHWIEKMVDLMQTVTKADIRHFDSGEIDEARKWLADSLD